MNQSIRVGVVADYNSKNRFHVATEASLIHAGASLGIPIECVWMDTDTLLDDSAVERFRHCHAIFAGTSSPYRSMEGALRAIRFAREEGWPFIGT